MTFNSNIPSDYNDLRDTKSNNQSNQNDIPITDSSVTLDCNQMEIFSFGNTKLKTMLIKSKY